MFLKRITAVLKKCAELTPEQLTLFETWEHYAKTLPYRFPNVDQDELSSIAYESLFKAVQSFDPSRDIAFTTYVTTIFDNAAINAFKVQKEHRTKEISVDTPVGGGDEGDGLDLKEVIEDIHDMSAADEIYFEDLMRFLKTKLEPFWFDFAESAVETGKFMEAVRLTNEKHNKDHLPQYYNQMMRKKILPAVEEFTGRNYKEEKEKREKAKVETEIIPNIKPEVSEEPAAAIKEEPALSPRYYEKVQQPLIEDEEDKSLASMFENILKTSTLNLIAEPHTYDLVVDYGEVSPGFIDGLIIDLGERLEFAYPPERDTQIEDGRSIKYIRYGIKANSEQEAINTLLKIFQEYDGEVKGPAYGDGIISVDKTATLNLIAMKVRIDEVSDGGRKTTHLVDLESDEPKKAVLDWIYKNKPGMLPAGLEGQGYHAYQIK